jgi:peptide/nickel transport system permease protein
MPGAGYLAERLFQAIVCILGIPAIVFGVTHLIGDPVHLLLPPEASASDREAFRASLGLDRPALERYGVFLVNAVQGNLGESYRYHMPVLDLVLERFPATLELAVAAMAFAIVLGIGSGMLSAVRPGSAWDRAVEFVALSGMAAPTFWVGVMLIWVFAVEWRLFPTSGRSGSLSIVLPAVTLGLYSAAVISRMTRSTVLEALGEDFVRTSVLKGAPRRVILFSHCLKFVLPALLTIVSLQFVTLLAGAVVTETVFSWPGIGRLLVQSASGGDYPVVQGITLLLSVAFVIVQFLSDVLQFTLDPRLRSAA